MTRGGFVPDGTAPTVQVVESFGASGWIALALVVVGIWYVWKVRP